MVSCGMQQTLVASGSEPAMPVRLKVGDVDDDADGGRRIALGIEEGSPAAQHAANTVLLRANTVLAYRYAGPLQTFMDLASKPRHVVVVDPR